MAKEGKPVRVEGFTPKAGDNVRFTREGTDQFAAEVATGVVLTSGTLQVGKWYTVIDQVAPKGPSQSGNFALLDQAGHFAIPDQPLTNAERRSWEASLTPGDQIELATFKKNVLRLFGVRTIAEINRVNIDERTPIAYRMIADQWGIRGSDEEIKEIIEIQPDPEKKEGYYESSVRERAELAVKLGKPVVFELSNAVASTSNVLTLLRMAISSGDRRVRFEAGKILDGMESVAIADKIDREESERRESAPTASVNNQLNTNRGKDRAKEDPDVSAINAIMDKDLYVSPESPSDSTLILSRHDKNGDFRCIGFERVDPRRAAIARYAKPKSGYLHTEIGERAFTHEGNEIPVYARVRKKLREAQVRKGRRKGTKNLRRAVEDTIGIRAVVGSASEIVAFHERLVEAFQKNGHAFTILEREDSLSGGSYTPKSPGSSEKLRVINLLAQIGPWLAEIQYYDIPAFIDSTAQDEVNYEEFELRRLYLAGIPQQDFPESIYHQPHEKIYESRVREIRSGIRIGLRRIFPA